MSKYIECDSLFNKLIIYFKKALFQDSSKYAKKLRKIIYRLLIKVSKVKDKKVNNKEVVDVFCQKIDEIIGKIKMDLIFIYESDPAALDIEEITLTYPGFFAIIAYRISHLFSELIVPYLPRMLSEYAHGRTGIDIHPGAKIDSPFCIDHGTGIVIGETTEIGHHVKIYQNVTLGALSLEKGQMLKGTKRHPTVGNFVTIYAGASILGGNTIIEDGVVVGSNVFITKSISKNEIIKK